MERELINEYLSGKSINEIARSHFCSYTKIRNVLISNNIKIRPKYIFTRIQGNCKKIDEDYFKSINSYDKAYWLGIILSDGTIDKKGYKISLTSKDLELIEKFRNAIGSEHKISKIDRIDNRNGKNYISYIIQIGSKKFVRNIINIGITTKKSYDCEFPMIDIKYYNSFIRGLFDGDGTISIIRNKLRIAFCSTEEIVKHIQNYFRTKYKIEPKKLYQLKNKSNMNLANTIYFKDTLKILEILYEDSNENNRLSRKYNLYGKFNTQSEL